MKIEIDTKAKTISVGEDVKLGDLMEFLESGVLKDWKKWTLCTNVQIVWKSNPIIIERERWYPRPYDSPYWSTGRYDTITEPFVISNLGTTGTNVQLNAHTYQLEVV